MGKDLFPETVEIVYSRKTGRIRHVYANEKMLVINEKNQVVAVWKAIPSVREIMAFKGGVAVRVRRGVAKES